jgi:voltage-gated potassium channel
MRDDILNPYRIWDLLITVCATLAAVYIPVQLVLGLHEQAAMAYVDWVITLFFVADMLVHLRRPVTVKGQVIDSPTVLARRYMKGWFVVDLLAAIPFGLLSGATLLQLLRLAKLARVVHLLRQWRQREIQNATLLRLIFFVYWLGLIAHWLACGWLALRGMPEDIDKWTSYLRALYWCITTLATVGYGDITPTTNIQMVYAMVVMLLGVAIYGYVIGNVANLLANIDLAKAHYLASLERLSTFMRYRNIPLRLQRRIYDYYAYLWENRLGYDESTVLAELPISLRTEVSLVLKREFIEKVPFFKGASQELIRDIALELRPVVFTPGDYIFKAGEIGRHMYFISRGTVEVISADGKALFATLRDGDFFGEIALLFSQPRSASIRAVDYCDLYALGKETFERILTHYPDFAMHMQEVARGRQEPRQ